VVKVFLSQDQTVLTGGDIKADQADHAVSNGYYTVENEHVHSVSHPQQRRQVDSMVLCANQHKLGVAIRALPPMFCVLSHVTAHPIRGVQL